LISADLKQGLAIAIENEDKHEMAINYMAQSSLLENPPADLERLEQAKNIFEELNDDFYLSRVCAALSNCYGVLLNQEKAKYYTEEAVRIARLTGSIVNLSLALGNLAEIEIAFGQYDVAQQHIQESSILGLKTHAWFLVAYCHCLSGFNRLLAGSFAEAETGGQKGLAVAEEIDHHYLKAFSLAVLSIWAGLTGQADSGKKWAEESNSITENNMMGLVLTPWGLSINYIRLGHWQEASQTLAVAFKQAEDQQLQAPLVWLMAMAALIAVEKGELETAVRFLSISKNHPFNATGWMAQWPRLAELETELKQQVGEEAYETAWAEGMACEPGMLPSDILVEVSNLLDSG
jgi:tetratricopeptide (TPR) repeat protein